MRIKIANRNRFISSVTMIMIALYVMITAIFNLNIVKGKETTDTTYIEYRVQAGDTLWSIAIEHRQNYLSIPDYIDDIKEVNYITGNTIYAGKCLILPVK